MAEVDRSVLEGKGVAELKEIAKTLDLKVSGLKKAEIVDKIAGNGSGGAGSRPKPKAAAPADAPKRELASEVTDVSPPSGNGVRDDGAVDERDHRQDERGRGRGGQGGPQGRNNNNRN